MTPFLQILISEGSRKCSRKCENDFLVSCGPRGKAKRRQSATASLISFVSIIGKRVYEKVLRMGDNDIFVKRVDFEVNNNTSEPISASVGKVEPNSDVEKLAESDKKETCTSKFCTILDKFGIKSALSHIALLASLGAWCFIGGWVINRSALPSV